MNMNFIRPVLHGPIICFALLAVFLPKSSIATESASFRNAEKYPCDVFSFTYCFRTPENLSVKLTNGPDFSVQDLMDSEANVVLSLYHGTAPSEGPVDKHEIREFRNGEVLVNAYSYLDSSGARTLELRFHFERGVWVHLFGADNDPARNKMYELLTTFRPCVKLDFTGVKCSSKSVVPANELQAIAKSMGLLSTDADTAP